jgi:protein-S-isoprenylcysteine O-methyltransferase Ste14
MANIDYAVYWMHAVFWGAFGVTRAILNRRDRQAAPISEGPVAEQEAVAPHSRLLVAAHGVGFALMYIGVGGAVMLNRVPVWFPGQRIAGSVVILGGSALMSWALTAFRSWRFEAKVERGHELALGGPFRFTRHPIYQGMNMLALGTAIWVPNILTWAAVAAMAIGSDLRARAEETLLVKAFGASYRDLMSRTSRFVPFVY